MEVASPKKLVAGVLNRSMEGAVLLLVVDVVALHWGQREFII